MTTPGLARLKEALAGNGSFLSTVRFSISHENGDGDFRIDAAGPVQTFFLGALLSGIKGSIVAVQVDLVESFDLVSGLAFLKMGPTTVGMLEDAWLAFETGAQANPKNGGFSMRDAPNQWIGNTLGVGIGGAGDLQESSIEAAPAPQIKFDNTPDANLNTATAGKVFITIHYLPPLAVP